MAVKAYEQETQKKASELSEKISNTMKWKLLETG